MYSSSVFYRQIYSSLLHHRQFPNPAGVYPGHRREIIPEKRRIYFAGDWLEDEVFDDFLKSGVLDKVHQTDHHQQAEELGHSNQDKSAPGQSVNGNTIGKWSYIRRPSSIEGESPTKPKSHPEANLSAQQYHQPESCKSEETTQSQPQKQLQSAIALSTSSRNVPVSNTTIKAKKATATKTRTRAW